MIGNTPTSRYWQGPWVRLDDYRLAERLRIVYLGRRIVGRADLLIPGVNGQVEEVASEYEKLINTALGVEGCSVVAIHWHLARDGLEIVVTHGSFDRVPEAETPPRYSLVRDKHMVWSLEKENF